MLDVDPLPRSYYFIIVINVLRIFKIINWLIAAVCNYSAVYRATRPEIANYNGAGFWRTVDPPLRENRKKYWILNDKQTDNRTKACGAFHFDPSSRSIKLINQYLNITNALMPMLFQEIERNSKLNVRPKLCHIWLHSQAFGALIPQAIKWSSASKVCEWSQIWHNFGRILNLVFLSISWILIGVASKFVFAPTRYPVPRPKPELLCVDSQRMYQQLSPSSARAVYRDFN